MEQHEMDPLTEGTLEALDPETPVADQLQPPASPPELDEQSVNYGDVGEAPVPPLEQARQTEEAAPGPSPQARHRCECGRYEVVNPATGEVVEATGCELLTKGAQSRFAPGHDAKLKGMLIRAGVRDYRVREIGTTRAQRATTIANRFERLGTQVQTGIERRRGR